VRCLRLKRRDRRKSDETQQDRDSQCRRAPRLYSNAIGPAWMRFALAERKMSLFSRTRPKAVSVAPQSKSLPLAKNEIDTSKRYDVYSADAFRLIVYRNVLVRGVRTLCGSGERFDITAQMLELELSNGQVVFINRHRLSALCEHGTDLKVEVIAANGQVC
jgi:hypothetical protein